MSKLTKPQIKKHEQARRLIDRGNLSHEETLFVFENYMEDAECINSKHGAFFTPFGLANDFTLQIPYKYEKKIKIIDLCAGIGVLSYAASLDTCNIICVEINPDYVEVGRKLLPQATWICGDALDPHLLDSLGHFDFAMANPPFGNIKSDYRKAYSSGKFEYMIIEAASRIADKGAFIIPQMSAPFRYSGTPNHVWLEEGSARRFENKTGIELEFNVGIDTTTYKEDWHGVTPLCEIVCCDFEKHNHNH